SRGLQGRRGEIVRLWARWAAAQPVSEPRAASDTAREFANRLDAPPSLEELRAEKRLATDLLERAHYDEEEPSEEHLTAMRQLTEKAIAREARGRSNKQHL